MATPLSQTEIDQALAGLPGWQCGGESLTKEFVLEDFRGAISFLVRLAFECEQLNHHPSIASTYNRVELRLTTHDAGGRVTARDVELARRVEAFSWVG